MAQSSEQLSSMIAAKGKITPLLIKDELKNWYSKNSHVLAKFLGDPVKAEKLYVAFATSVSRSPDLISCSKQSLINCLLTSAQLNLFPGALQECAYISFANNKTGQRDAQFIPQYQGLCKLILESGFVISISANVVYEADEFDFMEGSSSYIKHKRSLSANKGQRVAAYCCFQLSNGTTQFTILSPDEVESSKARSKGANSSYSPWNSKYASDVDWMWKKTAIKAAAKLMLKNSDKAERLASAIEVDNETESIPSSTTPIIDFSDVAEIPNEQTTKESNE